MHGARTTLNRRRGQPHVSKWEAAERERGAAGRHQPLGAVTYGAGPPGPWSCGARLRGFSRIVIIEGAALAVAERGLHGEKTEIVGVEQPRSARPAGAARLPTCSSSRQSANVLRTSGLSSRLAASASGSAKAGKRQGRSSSSAKRATRPAAISDKKPEHRQERALGVMRRGAARGVRDNQEQHQRAERPQRAPRRRPERRAGPLRRLKPSATAVTANSSGSKRTSANGVCHSARQPAVRLPAERGAVLLHPRHEEQRIAVPHDAVQQPQRDGQRRQRQPRRQQPALPCSPGVESPSSMPKDQRGCPGFVAAKASGPHAPSHPRLAAWPRVAPGSRSRTTTGRPWALPARSRPKATRRTAAARRRAPPKARRARRSPVPWPPTTPARCWRRPASTATARATNSESPNSAIGSPYSQNGSGNQLVPLGSSDGMVGEARRDHHARIVVVAHARGSRCTGTQAKPARGRARPSSAWRSALDEGTALLLALTRADRHGHRRLLLERQLALALQRLVRR